MKGISAILYLIILIFLAGHFDSNAQVSGFCGVRSNPGIGRLNAERAKLIRRSREEQGTYYVPIQFHLVATSTGAGYFLIEQVYDLLCNLNKQYKPLGIVFYIFSDPDYINESKYYVHDFETGMEMMEIYNVDAVTNVYIVQDPDGNCGYAYYPDTGPNGGGIVLAKSCSGPNNSTFAHEFGHYFNLPHTFDQWDFNPEFVNGSNCANSGDYFCDTPADFLDYRWGCPYNGTKTDPNGDAYNPDGSFFMSYSTEPCAYRFSGEQQDAILFSVVNDYNGDLVSHPVPGLSSVDTFPTLLFPVDSLIIEDSTNVFFEWDPVPGATRYQFVITKKGLLYKERKEIITTENSLVIPILRNKIYYEWRVKGLADVSTCAAFSPGGIFKVDHSFSAGIRNQTEREFPALISPNPIRNGDHIRISGKNKFDFIRIFSIEGKLKETKELSENGFSSLPLSLPSGVYIVEIIGGMKSVFQKLVIL